MPATPTHSPGTGKPGWVAILTVGSEAPGAMTTESKVSPSAPQGYQLSLPLVGSERRGRGRTVLMTAQSGS